MILCTCDPIFAPIMQNLFAGRVITSLFKVFYVGTNLAVLIMKEAGWRDLA